MPSVHEDGLQLNLETGEHVNLTDWSFSQLCRLSGMSKETVNSFHPETAKMAFRDTLPSSDKPIQLLTTGQSVRSLHGVSYTRLWNSELLEVVRDVATDFQPPQTAFNGGTGLYCGEQDMFCFLIDPLAGWKSTAKNSLPASSSELEVGRRSLGMQSFWFQRICQNHIGGMRQTLSSSLRMLPPVFAKV